jgi:hypothetical protein
MKEVAALLVAFLVIGLVWRKFTLGARIALLSVIVAVVAYMTVKQ